MPLQLQWMLSTLRLHLHWVAHDGLAAHAFTFRALWWEILPGNDDMKEDASQCVCNMTSFTDGQHLERPEDGKVMCGCSENACRI
jgi:hypothetical protein